MTWIFKIHFYNTVQMNPSSLRIVQNQYHIIVEHIFKNIIHFRYRRYLYKFIFCQTQDKGLFKYVKDFSTRYIFVWLKNSRLTLLCKGFRKKFFTKCLTFEDSVLLSQQAHQISFDFETYHLF